MSTHNHMSTHNDMSTDFHGNIDTLLMTLSQLELQGCEEYLIDDIYSVIIGYMSLHFNVNEEEVISKLDIFSHIIPYDQDALLSLLRNILLRRPESAEAIEQFVANNHSIPILYVTGKRPKEIMLTKPTLEQLNAVTSRHKYSVHIPKGYIPTEDKKTYNDICSCVIGERKEVPDDFGFFLFWDDIPTQ